LNRFVRATVIAAALVVAPLAAATPALAAGSATAPKKTAVVDAVAFETEVVKLTNARRAANGCSALRIDERLVAAARVHSTDMVRSGFFSHTGSNGSNFVAREVAAGYPRKGAAAENIAWGYRTPKDVVNGWMNSPGHRKNILNCASVAVGVGIAVKPGGAIYWTQDFGRI
jgi:uncharacterized protein YkwD